MKALVVSGGGAHGAYAGGVLEYLVTKENRDYDILLGTSTGSLITPLAAIGNIRSVKRGYLSVTQDDIFTKSPFKIDGNKRAGFKFFNALWSVLLGRKSLGDSSALEGTIKEFMSKEDYQKIKGTGKIVGCCVSNLSYRRKEYKFVKDYSYEQYVRWMHASSAVPPFMSLVKQGGDYYADGGITEKTPLQKTIDLGATEVDAIILDQKNKKRVRHTISNLFHTIQQSISMMMEAIGLDDITVGQLVARDNDVTVNTYYQPLLKGGALVFHPESMKKNWQLGYKNAQSKRYKQVFISPNMTTPKITYNGVKDELDNTKI